MAKKITSAERAALRSEKRRVRNRAVKTATKTVVDQARAALGGEDPQAAEQAVLAAVRALDKAARKGVGHCHGAARRKSRLMKQLLTLKASATAAVVEPTAAAKARRPRTRRPAPQA